MINRDNLKDLCPLTPMQEGMLYRALMEQDTGAYHEQITFQLLGDLNPDCYQQAWQILALRHDCLRSVFVINKTQKPLQAMLKQTPDFFSFQSLEELTRQNQQETIKQYIKDDLQQGFNLTAQPAIRVKLFKQNSGQWTLCWSFHHILLDGWSVGVLMSEMTQIYKALTRQQEPQLPPVPAFSQYLQWLSQQDVQTGKQFWQTYLNDYSETASLPAHGGSNKGTGATELKIELPDGLSEQLLQSAKANKVTVNALIQAAWGILLARYNDRQDVVFASVVSGRPSEIVNIERMVGLLINTVPVRVKFEFSEPISQLLNRLHHHNSASQAFQFMPMADIQPKPGAPDHLLVFENYHLETSTSHDANELSIQDIHTREQTDYDLTLVVAPGEHWQLTCLYNPECYGEHYLQQVSGHFFNLLQAIVEQPNAAVVSLPMMSEQESTKVLSSAKGVRCPYTEAHGLAALFEQSVADNIESTALVCAEKNYSYHQLNLQANRLAHRLAAAGVKPGDIVALLMPRDDLRIITVLAIIKAGAAYLGIEMDTPKNRIAWLCRDAGAVLLLGQTEITSAIDAVAGFDPYQEINQTVGDENPQLDLTGDTLAYLAYTSGSTGEPKGVAVSHKNVARLVHNTDFVEVTAEDVFLQFAPLSFDASTFEIWMPLLNGAKLVVMNIDQPSLKQLGAVIQQQAVSVLWLTAGLFHQMVDENISDLASVRQMLAGGDVVSPAHVNRLLSRFSDMAFINGYGPTENTTFSCCQRLPSELVKLEKTVPIGKAIAYSESYVLDKQLRPQPVGAIGQLYVAGAGVTYGYWNKPVQTATAFIPHPFSQQPGQRLYCTGDMVSVADEGLINFIGRADRQFKLRGYRIEAQEIEQAIKQLPIVQDVLIEQVQDDAGDKSLAAYVVLADESEFKADDIKNNLTDCLPGYLIPDFFIQIPEFPLTDNGKVNRALLPDPFVQYNSVDNVPPETEIEKALLAIWQQVLNIETFGINHDFFRLGGHSLKATQVVSLIRKQLDLEVPLKLIFEAPTIAQLAKKIQGLQNTAPSMPKLVKRDRKARRVS